MKIKTIVIILTLILMSCATITRQSIDKKLSKLAEKDNFIERVDKLLNNPKLGDREKAIIINGLHNYKRQDVNNYLKNDLFIRYKKNKNLHEIVLKNIIAQENTSNIDFFIKLIKQDQYLELCLSALALLGPDNFVLWKQHILTSDPFLQQSYLEVLKSYDYLPIPEMVDQYFKKNSEDRKILEIYLKSFKQELALELQKQIISKQITDYFQVSELIELVGLENIKYFIPLLRGYSADETISKMTVNIFSSFGNEVLTTLNSEIITMDSLEDKKLLYKVCEKISTENANATLKIWLGLTDNTFEKTAIIQALSTNTDNLPDEFIAKLDDPTAFYDVLKTIDKYLKSSQQSVIRGYRTASNIGKIRLLNYFIDNSYDELLVEIAKELNSNSDNVKIFACLKLIEKSISDEWYEPFIRKSIMSDNFKLFEVCSEYINRNHQNFEEYLFQNKNSLFDDPSREELIIPIFSQTKNYQIQAYLYDKYFDIFTADKFRADLYGKAIMSNKYLEINRITEKSKLSNNNQDAMVALLNHSSLEKNNKKIYEIIIKEYQLLSIENKLKIIASLKHFNPFISIAPWLEKYETMSLLEKQYLTTVLQYFPWDEVKDYALKMIYLAEDDQLFFIRNLLEFVNPEDIDDDFKTAFAYYYFKVNDFAKAKFWLKNTSDERADMILKNINECISSDKYSASLSVNKGELATNVLRLKKSLLQSYIEADYIINSEVVKNLDKSEYEKKKLECKDQIENIDKFYANYLKIYDQESDMKITAGFLSKVISKNIRQELSCGNIKFKPQSGHIFIEILVKIENLVDSSFIVDPDLFFLSSKDKIYYPDWRGKYYIYFNKSQQTERFILKPISSNYLTLLFEVETKSEVLRFEYQSHDYNDHSYPHDVNIRLHK